MENKINYIISEVGPNKNIILKNFYTGKNKNIKITLLYVKELCGKENIEKSILIPLMTKMNSDLTADNNAASELCDKYLPMSQTLIESDLNKIIYMVKSGFCVLVIENCDSCILCNVLEFEQRAIQNAENETSMRGSKEGFVEDLVVNLSLIKRRVKDKTLSVESLKIGKKTETELNLIYIDSIVDKKVLNEVKRRISLIDTDGINDSGEIEQYIEDNSYSPFPQMFGTQRPDVIISKLLQGRIAIILNGSCTVILAPSLFYDFFETIEDNNERSLVSSFSKTLRALSVVIVLSLSPIYLTLLKFNSELIPLKFFTPIVQSRVGIPFTPFWEILLMEIVVEFLREGGLRLPPKIAPTLSIVGGIIIGNTAVQSKIVSPTTLLVIGITIISTFLIPNYEMSLSIRFLRFPMLIIANSTGFIGIGLLFYLILIHLCSLQSFGTPYFPVSYNDLINTLIKFSKTNVNEADKNRRKSN